MHIGAHTDTESTHTYISIYIYIYTHIHTYIHTHTHVHVYAFVDISMYLGIDRAVCRSRWALRLRVQGYIILPHFALL